MFIYREDKYRENEERTNIAEIRIEKHRNGPTGKIELYFHEESATFRNLDKHFEGSVDAFGTPKSEGIEIPI
jgi:replicative DNA helicase